LKGRGRFSLRDLLQFFPDSSIIRESKKGEREKYRILKGALISEGRASNGIRFTPSVSKKRERAGYTRKRKREIQPCGPNVGKYSSIAGRRPKRKGARRGARAIDKKSGPTFDGASIRRSPCLERGGEKS